MGMTAQQLLQSDPEFIRRQLIQQEAQRLNPSGDAAGAIGGLLGRGIGNVASGRGFFAANDAGLRRVTEVQQVLSNTPFDPNNPAAYYESVGESLRNLGYGDLAPSAFAEATKIREREKESGLKKEELGLRGRQVAVQEADVEIKQQQAKEPKETNLVTTKGDTLVRVEGKLMVQETDDEGNITYKPYSRRAYGPVETRSAANQGSVQRQPVYNAGGIVVGYDIIDNRGNFVRRELFKDRGATGAAPQEAAPATKDKKSRPSLGSLLYPGSQK